MTQTPIPQEPDYTPEQLYRGIVNAVDHGNLEDVRYFAEEGADINARDADGMTVLQRAVYNNRYDMALYLIGRDADVHARCDASGNTALHYAVNHGHLALAKLLLDHGADVNAPNMYRQAPLHRVARGGSVMMAEVLLAYGADLLMTDYKDRTAADIAAERAKPIATRAVTEVALFLADRTEECRERIRQRETSQETIAALKQHTNRFKLKP